MSRFDKIFYLIFFSLVFYITIGFKLIPYIVEDQLIKNLNKNLTVKSKVERVFFNPFSFEVIIKNFQIGEKREKVFSVEELRLDLALFYSISNSHINIKEVIIDKVDINIKEYQDSTFNFEKLLKPTNKKEEETTKSNDIKFLVRKIVLKDSAINFTKDIKNKRDYKVSLNNINYKLYDLGTYKNSLASSNLDFTINNSAKVISKGAFKISPSFDIYGNLTINDLVLNDILNYKKEILNFDLYDKAKLSTNLDYKFSDNLILHNHNLSIDDLEIRKDNTTLVEFKTLDIDDTKLDLNSKKISLDTVSLNNPLVQIIKKQNQTNLNNMIKTTSSNTKEQKKREEKEPWSIVVTNTNIENFNFMFKDYDSNINIQNQDFFIKANNLIVKEDIKLNSLNISNPFFSLKDNKNRLFINSKKVEIGLQSLVYDKNIFIDSISLNNESTNINDRKSKLDINSFNNKIKIDKLNLENSNILVDKIDLSPNLTLNKDGLYLKASKMKIEVDNFKQNQNGKIYVKKTNLSNPNIEIKLKESKEEKNKSKKTSSQSKENKQNAKLDLGPIQINNATLKFSDESLPVQFNTAITKLNGKVSQLDTTKASQTKLEVNGVVNKYGVSKITGLVNPNDIKILTDVKMIFKNISLKDFTPYSSKFVGREIDDGKLFLDLKYNIEKSNLDAKNKVIIKEIELGEQVKSDDAVSLPLDLAIALLEDTNGVIDLDLPISGDLDNPEFSVGHIVWKAFTNLIMKAITAPFSLLGAMFGFDEDEIKSVNFDYGQKIISPIQKETLDKITKILKKRPNLALKLTPTYHKVEDLKALKLKSFNNIIDEKIPNKQIKEFEKRYMEVLEKEYLKYHKDLKIKKEFTKDKKLDYKSYITKLEKIVISKQNIKEEDLQQVAKSRVKSIKEYLVNNNKVENKQIKIEDSVNILENNEDTLSIEIDLSSTK